MTCEKCKDIVKSDLKYFTADIIRVKCCNCSQIIEIAENQVPRREIDYKSR